MQPLHACWSVPTFRDAFYSTSNWAYVTYQGSSLHCTALQTSISEVKGTSAADLFAWASISSHVHRSPLLIHWGTAVAPWHSRVQPMRQWPCAAATSSALAPSALQSHSTGHRQLRVADLHSKTAQSDAQGQIAYMQHCCNYYQARIQGQGCGRRARKTQRWCLWSHHQATGALINDALVTPTRLPQCSTHLSDTVRDTK